MTPAQKRAIERHRRRLKDNGMARVEGNVPENDKSLIKAIASKLRNTNQESETFRHSLAKALASPRPMTFKELLECAPLDGVDLERSKEGWREVEL